MERGTFSRAFLNAMVQIYAPFLSLLIVEERVAAAGRERNVQTVHAECRQVVDFGQADTQIGIAIANMRPCDLCH